MILGTLARGLLIGALLAWVASRTRFAHARGAAAIAMAATVLAILGAHYQVYSEQRHERIATANELRDQSAGYGRDLSELNQEFDAKVASLTFGNYLREYFGLKAGQEGDARDAAASKAGPAIGIGLYVLELLIALLAAAYYPAGTSSEPACSRCGRWYSESTPKKAAHGVGSEFVSMLETGSLPEALSLLEPPDTDEWLGLSIATCPKRCADALAILRVRTHARPRASTKLVTRHLADLELDGNEHQQIEGWS